MYKNYIRVPRLYKVAATVAQEHNETHRNIKKLVLDKRKKHPNLKAIFALVSTLYQHEDVVEHLLKKSRFFEKEKACNPWVIKILVVELLWGKKCFNSPSPLMQSIQAYEQIFKAHLSDVNIGDTKVLDEGLTKPRYVRVNTLNRTVEEVVNLFREEDWTLVKHVDKTDYAGFLEKIASLKEFEFMVDIHIPELLIFPPKAQFHEHPAYKNGTIILQDKASCLPVHLLAPPPGAVVVDMCAAPGMKTTHLAAAMVNQGTIYSVERDDKRLNILRRMVESSGATCVKVVHKDVLACTTKDFPDAEYILVDPSCSGSGMSDRDITKEHKDPDRFQKLTGFQIMILRSALIRYPNVKRVVYSTCSLYPEENEDVVRQVLETLYNFRLVPAKTLMKGAWHSYGSPDFGELGEYCLYARPDEDMTCGFFIAVFERLKEGEENKFLNNKLLSFKKQRDSKEARKERKAGKMQEKEKMDERAVTKKNKRKKTTVNEVQDVSTEIFQERKDQSVNKTNREIEKGGMYELQNNKGIQLEGYDVSHNTDKGYTIFMEPKKKKNKTRESDKEYVTRNEEITEIFMENDNDGVSGTYDECIEKQTKKKKDKKNKHDPYEVEGGEENTNEGDNIFTIEHQISEEPVNEVGVREKRTKNKILTEHQVQACIAGSNENDINIYYGPERANNGKKSKIELNDSKGFEEDESNVCSLPYKNKTDRGSTKKQRNEARHMETNLVSNEEKIDNSSTLITTALKKKIKGRREMQDEIHISKEAEDLERIPKKKKSINKLIEDEPKRFQVVGVGTEDISLNKFSEERVHEKKKKRRSSDVLDETINSTEAVEAINKNESYSEGKHKKRKSRRDPTLCSGEVSFNSDLSITITNDIEQSKKDIPYSSNKGVMRGEVTNINAFRNNRKKHNSDCSNQMYAIVNSYVNEENRSKKKKKKKINYTVYKF